MVGVAKTIAKVGGLCFVAGFGLTFGGCAERAPEPAQLGRFRPTPAVNVILNSLGVADEPTTAWENAEDPKPQDVMATARRDRTLRPGDTVRVSVYELLREGVTTTKECVVSETGKIAIPDVGVVPAGGMTEAELEQEIKRALAPAILKKPYVSVTLIHSPPRTFAILGAGVKKPDRYTMSGDEIRLTDALAAAGLKQTNVSHVYVSRKGEAVPQGSGLLPAGGMDLIEPATKAATPKPQNDAVIPPPVLGPDGVPQPSQPAEKFENQQEMLDLITPSAKGRPSQGLEQKRQNDTPSLAPLSDPTDISATMLPGGFRLITPAQPVRQPQPSQDEIVQSLTEFGGGAASRATPPSGGPGNGGVEWLFQDGKWVSVPSRGGAQKAESGASGIEDRPPQTTENKRAGITPPETAPGQNSPPPFVFREGRWVPTGAEPSPAAQTPVQTAPMGVTLPMEKTQLPAESEWDQGTPPRLIKIPVDRLLAGDPRYNVIIRPGDVIHVPEDIVGQFCITGNVVRPGCYSLTGRPMTVKQAIAVAQGLTPMACPKYCEIVRRIGPNNEVIDMFDLDKIANGEQPDFFLKPNDLINVGTNPSPQWRAAMRDAQKPAGGLTFGYGRNFNDADYGASTRGEP